MQFNCASVDKTQELAAKLGEELRAGDVLILSGDLGAGKTTFTQGIAKGMQVRAGIISPTFVIARNHPSLISGPNLVHIDAYRLNSADELYDLDIESDLGDSVLVAEWGDGFVEEFSDSYLRIMINRGTGERDESRAITIEPHGPRWEGWELTV
ncbi:MAG: tRNA (adenosine(37)-N6)-threonylcarbamoyltransferase complex ATPase subunit type 1 TsaE [Micrococcaceae bacterium]